MPIVGFNINKIEANKAQNINGQLEIKSDLKIVNVSEEKFMDNERYALKFGFSFIVNYEPKYANILIDGDIMFVEEKNKAKEIIDKWKKDKRLDPKITERLFNNILTKCNIKTLQITQDLNLPPHVRLPMVVSQQENKNSEKKKDNYIG